jgi:hypothetical protein
LVEGGWAAATDRAREVTHKVRDSVRSLWTRALLLTCVARRLGRPLLASLVVGVAVGAGCYLAGPAVASAVGGFGAMLLSLAASAARRVWRLLRGEADAVWV